MSPDKFEPLILGFLCNWCSYAGADLAGTSRIQYPSHIRIIRVMCSGRIDPTFILVAFARGIRTGCSLGGCHPGECHYIEGDFKARRRIELVKKLLNDFGIEQERLRLEWISASEGPRFGQVVADFTDQIKGLGPSPLKNEKY